jgi:hypothetical protein
VAGHDLRHPGGRVAILIPRRDLRPETAGTVRPDLLYLFRSKRLANPAAEEQCQFI